MHGPCINLHDEQLILFRYFHHAPQDHETDFVSLLLQKGSVAGCHVQLHPAEGP